MRRLQFVSVFFVSLFLFLPGATRAQSGRTPTPARHGMVVSSHYLASTIGSEILQEGGSAVDAAVATAFVLSVVYPSAGNIGGGGFMVYQGADGKATTFNFRERAPLAATEDMYLDESGHIRNRSNHEGLLAVGVPGTVAGLFLAHERLGTLPWKDLVEPAIQLADNGFAYSWYNKGFGDYLQRTAPTNPLFQTTADVWLKEGNIPYEPGETIRLPELAETLKLIRDNGKDGFYAGHTAELIDRFMRKNDGLITKEDLAAYEANEQAPIHGTYRGYDIYGMAPPSSGGVVIVEMLNILEGFDLSSMGLNSALYMHVVTEAMRRAFADRAFYLGDPRFNPDMPLDMLTSKEHAKEMRASIDLFRASPSDSSRFGAAYAQAYESEETTHLSVVDSDGNAVSMTYTLEYSYGSRIMVPGGGFLLNNEMGDFNPIPGYTATNGLIGTPPNRVAPKKNMLSSMSPSIVAKDGKPYLVIGSPGGRTIINTTLEVILNVIDGGMNVAQAIEAPRFHHQWLPDITSMESLGISADSRRLYEMMGHKVRFRGSQGHAMGIMIDPESGILYGGADSRSYDSRAVGY